MRHSFSLFILSCLLFFSIKTLAHQGEPEMAFAWQEGGIKVDILNLGQTLGDYTAFVIPFTGSLRPYHMGDSGFSGIGFNQGGIIHYQAESTLLKWSKDQQRWLQEGFDEQILIRRLADEILVTANDGNGLQGYLANVSTTTQFEGHSVFQIQTADGTLPEDGAYIVFMRILGVDDSNGDILYGPSDPFALVFHINAQQTFNNQDLTMAMEVEPEVRLNDYNRLDALFDWAEVQFKDLFPHSAESRFIFGYYARCYDNSVCVGSKDGKIFTTGGILGGITEQGSNDVFYDLAGI